MLKNTQCQHSPPYSLAPGSIFAVQSYSRNAITASSISPGPGIAVDAWFPKRAEFYTFIVGIFPFPWRKISRDGDVFRGWLAHAAAFGSEPIYVG